MNQRELIEELENKLVELDHKGFKEKLENALRRNVSVEEIIFGAMANGMMKIGDLYEKGEYFLTDMLIATEIFREAMKKLRPLIGKSNETMKGTVVIGTVRGDIHDIGKNLVATMLEASGFKVVDLGVDVPKKKFIEAVKKHKANILALSSLLSVTVKEMEAVISELVKEKLRKQVKVIIGGLPTSETLTMEIGADAHGKDAVEAVKKCEKLVYNLRKK